jgi:hypothetical protein
MAISYFIIGGLFWSTCGEVFMDYSKNAVSRFFMDEIKYLPVEEKFLMLASTVYRFIP